MNSESKFFDGEEDYIFWEQRPFIPTNNRKLNVIEANDIVNKLMLSCQDAKTLEEAEQLKSWIKNREV
ncbi:hypothetical protein Phi4:1_gp157 [Cellulophaga phage phi4:1]|uniref:Uncharacterized protein n=3 Tax=Lightbulbvirus Cba41 TaxID=1918524 RepID=A0A0S2MWT0_9CAUD|nr:hypothetical protein Phi4:1_gp157 [Cellulophaga phage phi4:1]AGO49570.1 hypothetical protein Phi4:1_gp157 [Cellulophaga phage phi4:1]ALO80166.1 hypothetical protein Phi4113_157 [Cellulophaga phage phi4:1_13]ALO80363.1 hypothetical protein Phi4118_157 [Cellulophaga phage phi4:1_18]